MLNFSTLFDSNYSAKGLVLHQSLVKHCSSFHLYIFAFDNNIYEVLKSMKLASATIISLAEFEDEALLQIKNTRSKAEYCWTCTSSTILYSIQKYNLDHCTYIDADLCFFSDPKVLIEEMGNNDVLITSHRYTYEFDTSEVAGKYCVQFMTFKNTTNGLAVLNWWRNACLDWCYARIEDGKFGDQKYLDDWPIRFSGIHELRHLGGGVAPWNMQQYSFAKHNNEWQGTELTTGHEFKLVFFHFHAMLSFRKGIVREFYFEAYPLSFETRELIYKPYITELKAVHKFLSTKLSIDSLATKRIDFSWMKYLRIVRKRILNNENKYAYWFRF